MMTEEQKRLKINERARRWRKRNPKKHAAINLRCYYKNHEHSKRQARKYWFKRRYGLTMDEAADLLSKPCEICGRNDNQKIDHDHSVKELHVRGVLFNSCNLLLGRMEALGIGKFCEYLIRK